MFGCRSPTPLRSGVNYSPHSTPVVQAVPCPPQSELPGPPPAPWLSAFPYQRRRGRLPWLPRPTHSTAPQERAPRPRCPRRRGMAPPVVPMETDALPAPVSQPPCRPPGLSVSVARQVDRLPGSAPRGWQVEQIKAIAKFDYVTMWGSPCVSYPSRRGLTATVPPCLRGLVGGSSQDEAFLDSLSQKADSQASGGSLLDDKASSKKTTSSPPRSTSWITALGGDGPALTRGRHTQLARGPGPQHRHAAPGRRLPRQPPQKSPSRGGGWRAPRSGGWRRSGAPAALTTLTRRRSPKGTR
ncbi:hypothetical protein HPG69_008036 [Diceros bicornis minor]|uniref:Uncharacterized protein n=1 Tax=Diceros bicornis minor TaxID=77932 RepID=A0A7J7F3N2_DICBM|nr:hypothetical protein HPG69_008036 [Diceros bicornis minor]